MSLAYRREVELVLRVMRLHEVMRYLMRQREVPEAWLSDYFCDNSPDITHQEMYAVDMFPFATSESSVLQCQDAVDFKDDSTRTPCFIVSQVAEQASTCVERNETACHVVEYMQAGGRKSVHLA